MKSISRHIDEFDIAQEVRLERKLHKGSFLLLEGVTDIKRFDPFIDSAKCAPINCYGKRNAIGAIEILYDEGFLGAVAVIDADFDRIFGGMVEHEGLIYSEGHDLDLDWATDGLIERYLREHGDNKKCAAHGSVVEIRKKIQESLKPISVAKLLNRRGLIQYQLSNIDISICCKGFSVDLSHFVAQIQSKPALTADQQRRLATQIANASAQTYDFRQLTNGHDFCALLGVALRTELGDRRDLHTWASEVEAGFRLMFGVHEIRNAKVWRDLLAWEVDNAPFAVLDRAFV